MELATLCDIDACTIIIGPDGEVDSWPENPASAGAIIKNFKDSTSEGLKRMRIQDEDGNVKTVGPDRKIESWPAHFQKLNLGTAILKNFKGSTNDGLLDDWDRFSTVSDRRELDFKLEALTQRRVPVV